VRSEIATIGEFIDSGIGPEVGSGKLANHLGRRLSKRILPLTSFSLSLDKADARVQSFPVLVASRSLSAKIHALEDLLHYAQSLGLAASDSSQIERKALLGQGVSYKVFSCVDRKCGSAVAVKRVKLPL
jgi:hypothetical protein